MQIAAKSIFLRDGGGKRLYPSGVARINADHTDWGRGGFFGTAGISGAELSLPTPQASGDYVPTPQAPGDFVTAPVYPLRV